MNKPVATRVLQNLHKYDPVVKLLGEKHPEFSRTVNLVKLAIQGLAKYYGLFILDQHGKLIFAARLEDDYSRNVTLIGRELKTWARNPDLTLKGKIGLTRLYSVLERCLRDALELYNESEMELLRNNINIYMSTSDAYGEYERAKAALWKFQHDFHLHQIDPHRGSDRAIIYNQPGFAGPPVGFVNNFEFTRPDWKEPGEDCIKVLTEEEQTQLKSFISRPEVQKLLPSDLRNPNSEKRPRARTPVEVRRKVALAVRAFLGRRHNEYSLALAVDPDTEFAEDEDEDEDNTEDGSMDGTMKGSMDSSMNDFVDGSVDGSVDCPVDVDSPKDNIKDLPYDDEARAAHLQLTHTARQNTAHDVGGTALLHWAGATKAKREERIEGHRRLRAILKWAEREGHVPLSPTSIRATTGLRRGIFTPLDTPDLPPPRRRSRRRVDPEAYCDAALENLKNLRPLLDLTLLAFLFNQDALRLFGGLVGEHPLPSDLGRMDKVLRELEVYTEVCAHRRRLIVGHLKRTREFPLALAAQSGDLRAALQDAEEARLAASRRCFEYVAERSRPVMGYPGGKRRRREFAGQFLVRDRQKLEHLSGVEDEAAALREELEEAEEWLGWCEEVMGEWTLGWRPGRVEKDMLYVDEETQADVRRYKWEINQKRAAIGLVPVRRPQDEVYKRQQDHIELLDILWKLMS
ncbi:hypothetical protein SLS64_008450 [Diaporthe eres]